jgi:N-acetylglucosaminyl-diphospho-decaprenol L-rhamnosyltransferase
VTTDTGVAVVVVTFNSAGLLPDLLGSLEAGMGAIPWQLIVADNASVDGTLDVVWRMAPMTTVVEMKRNAGYAAGINAGVAAAGPHSAVLVLNPDVRLTAGCVPTLLSALARPCTGIAVPRLLDAHLQLIHSMRREPTVLRALGDAILGARRAGRFGLLGEVVTDERQYAMDAVTEWAEGSTLLISRECWRRCAPWDESFFLYSEEADFALRARDAGLVTRDVPTACAVHLEGGSGSSPGLWALLTLNKVRLYSRRHGRTRTAAFWGALLVREASRAVMGKPTSRAAVRALLSPARMREPRGPASVRLPTSVSAR